MPNQSISPQDIKLAEKYKPLLVLYQEIQDGSKREDHYFHIGERPGKRPLDQDYHPRDISLVLDHIWLNGKKGKDQRENVLRAMTENKVKHVDLIDKGGPKDVEKFWNAYAAVPDKDNNPEYRRKAYTRVIRGRGRHKDYISIQYWFAYFFDDWANVHEMDWEMVAVILKKSGATEKPVRCVCCAHIGAFKRDWEDVDKADDRRKLSSNGSHPVVYVANGSHAAYFTDKRPFFVVLEPYLKGALKTVVRASKAGLVFYDYVPGFSEGEKHFPDIAVVPGPGRDGRWEDNWRWLNFKGNWGSPVELSLRERSLARIPLVGLLARYFSKPIREAAPKGPNTRGSCWSDPIAWSERCINA